MRAPRPKKKVRQPRSPGPGRSSFLCGFCVSSECLVVDLSGEEVVFPSYPSPGPPSSASLESRRQSGRQDGPKTFPRCPPDPPAPRPRSPQDPPSPQIAVGPPKIGPRSTTIAPRPPRPPRTPSGPSKTSVWTSRTPQGPPPQKNTGPSKTSKKHFKIIDVSFMFVHFWGITVNRSKTDGFLQDSCQETPRTPQDPPRPPPVTPRIPPRRPQDTPKMAP